MNELAMVLHGSSRDGHLCLNEIERARMLYILTQIPGPVEVVIRRPNRERSKCQNSYYWGVVIRLITDYTGETAEDAHRRLKTMCGLDSTTRLSTRAFEEYIEQCRAWAAEQHIIIPDPDRASGWETSERQ